MIVGPIYSNTANNKRRIWFATLALFNKEGKNIKIESLNMEILDGWYSEYTTTSGIIGMTMTTSEPTKITTGKNLGKRNATNVLQQAHSEVTSKMNVKIKAGYSLEETEETEESENTSKEIKFPFAMAVKNVKDHPEKVIYPTHLQCKLDGIRAIAAFVDGEVVMKTRRLHDIVGFEDLRAELKELFLKYKKRDGLFIDGELYNHGMQLQTISGIVRGSDSSHKNELQFHVFDAFRTEGNQLPFEDRLLELSMFTRSDKKLNYVTQVETVIVSNSDEADKFYEERRSQGYEGAIYKPFGRPYEWSFTREKRSSWYLKRKAAMDAEYKIVGYDQGSGKDASCIVFTFETEDGVQFSAVPNGPYEYRKELYQRAKENFEQFRNQYMTIQYEDLSQDNVPLRARGKAFRDLKFD